VAGTGSRLAAFAASVAFTTLLFTGLGLLQRQEPESAPSDPLSLTEVSLPPIPPPPPEKPPEQQTQEEPVVDLIGFQLARSDSPVKIAATPLLADDPRQHPAPPSAYIKTDQGALSFKPRISTQTVEPGRIYSAREVDQRATAVYKKRPRIRGSSFSRLSNPKINMLFVVDEQGKVAEVRILRSTGDSELDELMVDAMRQWQFTPAMRRGKPVRQWFEQLININIGSGNPFEAN